MISKNYGDVTTYAYDVWGNMISAGSASYAYNAQGLRVSKAVNGSTDSFVLVGGDVWADSETTYLRGLELISSDDYFYLYNIRGDVIQLLDYDGEVVKTYDYDAYGNELSRDLSDENPFRYCGEYYDTETGLIYLRARYYDPSVGRFTSKDIHWNPYNSIYGDNPVKTQNSDDCTSYYPDDFAIRQSSNQYTYCINNPIMYTDSNGRWIHIAIGTVVGAAVGATVEIITLLISGEEFDLSQFLISTVSGAVSGLVTSLGGGSLAAGIIAGCFSIIKSADKNNYQSIDFGAALIDAVLAGVGAKIFTMNVGHLDKMGSNLFKRIGHSLSNVFNNGIDDASNLLVSILKAFDYYSSQTSTLINQLNKTIALSSLPAAFQDFIDTLIGRIEENDA